MSRKSDKFKAWRINFSSGLWVIGSKADKHSDTQYLYIPDKDGTFSRKDPHDYLSDISMMSRWNEFFDKDLEEEFNREFWESPHVVYHGTKSMSGIMRGGIEPRSESRGLNNRSVGKAVFTTLEPSAAESYAADGMVAIDTSAMKRDRRMPYVSEEPDVLEQRALGAIAHRIGVNYNEEYSDAGVSPDTVILYGKIPSKYLKVME